MTGPADAREGARGSAHEAPPVASGDIAPVESGSAAPIRRAAVSSPTRAALAEATVSHPYRSAVDQETYDAIKSSATDGSAASPATRATSRSPIVAPLTPAVTSAFEGIDKPGAKSHGWVYEPSDAMAAKSESHILEGTNTSLRLFTNDGTTVQTMDLNTFFGASFKAANNGLDLLFDPRVYFDRNSVNQRFYVATVQSYGSSDKNGFSKLWVAVSRSPDPNSLDPADWCTYGINARRDSGTKLSSWMDYTQLGVGRDALLISGNQYRFTNGSYTYPLVRAFNKTSMANNAASCPTVRYFTFQPTYALNSLTTFSLQPVQAYNAATSFKGTKNPAYLLSSDLPLTSSAAIHVWRIRNLASGAPTMGLKTLSGTYHYAVPPNADQPDGTGVVIDTGDSRVRGAVGRNDTLHGALSTSCQVNTGAAESCILYFRVNVSQTKKGYLNASLAEEFARGEADGTFVYYPGLAVNQAAQVAASALVSSSDALDPNAGYEGTVSYMKNESALNWTTAVFDPGQCARPTSDPVNAPNIARAGDFTSVQTDPSDGLTFWYAGEFAKDAGGGSCTWGTRIAAITP